MIEWNETLELGIEKIDNQHQTLIQTLEDIYDACSRGEGMQQLEQTLKFLEWYVVKHFSDEELIQEKCNYTQRAHHQEIHQRYASEVRRIKEDFQGDRYNPDNLSRVIAYLIHMLKVHIEYDDKLLADFIKNKGTDEWEMQLPPLGKDYLTGLLTEKELHRHLDEWIEKVGKDRALQVNYITMKIDGFEEVNKSYGYEIGDEVIIYVSGILHAIDHKGVVVGRAYKDEFLMLVPSVGGAGEVTGLLDAIKQAIYCGFKRKGSVIPLSISMGVVRLGPEENNIKAIHQKATIALGVAFERGPNQTVWFEETMYEKTKQKAKMLNWLQPYHLDHYLRVAYQPIFDVNKGVIKGAEALLRMVDDEGNIISPTEFIPLAEANYLMKDIGYFCIRQVCQMLQQLQYKNHNLKYISINLSVQQFKDTELVEQIRHYAKAYGIDPKILNFEIVESMIIEDFNQTQKVLKELKALGGNILLDDFGSGYSALSYLSQVAVDVVKIDRSFLKSIDQNDKAQIVLGSMINLVHALGMETVVEGVETEAELALVRSFGAHTIQGYLLSRPLMREAFLELF